MADSVYLGSVYADFDLRTSKFAQGLSQVQSQMVSFGTQTNNSLDKIFGSLDNLANKTIQYGMILGTALTAAGIAGAKSAAQITGDFEMNRVAFETMLGSADLAKDTLKKLSDFAQVTPFTLPQVVDASKQLLAYGFTADELIPTMRRLGDVAAGLNIPMSDMAYIYGTLKTQGRAYTRDILQFTQRGIPVLEALSQELGKSKTEIMDMVAAGQVGFPEVEKAFQMMTGEGGKFNNLMDKQSKTFPGILSNIKDGITRIVLAFMGMDTGGDIAEGSAYYKMKEAAQNLMVYLSDNKDQIAAILQGMANSVIDFIEKLAKLFKMFMDLPKSTKEAILKIGELGLAFLAFNVFLTKTTNAFKGIVDIFASLKGASLFGSLFGKAGATEAVAGAGAAETATAGIAVSLSTIVIVVGVVIAALVALWLAVKSNFGGIRTMFQSTFANFASTWSNFKKTLEDALAPIGGLAGAWKTFIIVLKAVGFAVGIIIIAIIELYQLQLMLITFLLRAGKAIQDFVVSIPGFMAKWWDNMLVGVNNIVKSITGVWGTFTDWVAKKWSTMIDAIISNWGKISGAVTVVWQTFTTWVSNQWSKMINTILYIWHNFPYLLGYGIGTAIKIVSIGILAIISWFASLPGRIQTFIITIAVDFVNWSIKMGQIAVQTGINIFNGIVNWLVSLPGTIATFFVTIWTDFITWATNMNTAANETGKNIFYGIINWLIALPGNVWQKMKEMADTIWNWATNAYNAAVNFGQNIQNGIIDWIKGLPGEVGTILSNIFITIWNWAKSMYMAGVNFGNQFWRGIKDALGIHSPSIIERTFESIGKNLMGIVGDWASTLGPAMQALTPNISASYAPTIASGAISGGVAIGQPPVAGGSVTNINVGTLIGDESSMRELEKRVARATKQNATAKGASVNSYLEGVNA